MSSSYRQGYSDSDSVKKIKSSQLPIKRISLKEKMICKLRGKDKKLSKQRKNWMKEFKIFIKHKQRNYTQNFSASSCQFSCPICLQMLMTPCPTSCGHVFCFRCIDESVIRNGNCPSCRNYIRNQEFVQSLPLSKLSYYYWMTSCQKQSYEQKYKKNEQWLISRRLQQAQLKINQLIDARDTEHIWCKAKIINIFEDYSKKQLLIHFQGWNEIYDEVIDANSQRLAPYNFFSQRQDIPKYKLSSPEGNMRSRIQYGDFRDRMVDRIRIGSESLRQAFLNIESRRMDREGRPILNYLNLSNLHPNYQTHVVQGSSSQIYSDSITSQLSQSVLSGQEVQQFNMVNQSASNNINQSIENEQLNFSYAISNQYQQRLSQNSNQNINYTQYYLDREPQQQQNVANSTANQLLNGANSLFSLFRQPIQSIAEIENNEQSSYLQLIAPNFVNNYPISGVNDDQIQQSLAQSVGQNSSLRVSQLLVNEDSGAENEKSQNLIQKENQSPNQN